MSYKKKMRLSTRLARTSALETLGLVLIASYLPSATASVPVDDPSMNSIGAGRRLLNVSRSLAGL